MSSDTFSEPAEQTATKITVRHFHHGSRDVHSVASVDDAIAKVKEVEHGLSTCIKIDIDGDVVFDSTEHDDIGLWENEWKRAKRRMSVDTTAWDCPHNTPGCIEDDLCLECQMDRVDGDTL